MFGKKNLEKDYEKKALDYIDDREKTDGLLQKALFKGNQKKNSLGDTWDKLQLFVELVRSYSKGEYRNVSKSTIVTIVGALIYFISPLDAVPDFIIGLGLIDDAAVIGYTLKKISAEIDEFKTWKQSSR